MFHSQGTKLKTLCDIEKQCNFISHQNTQRKRTQLGRIVEIIWTTGLFTSPTIKIMASIVPAGLLFFVMYINLVHVLPFKVNSDSEGKI